METRINKSKINIYTIFYFFDIFCFCKTFSFDRMIAVVVNLHKGREKMTKRRMLSLILGSIALFALTACGSNEIPNAKNWEIEEFSFINQEKETVSNSDLKGKVWIADFIFTSCEDVCLPMTWNMSKLQKMLKDEGIKIEKLRE